MPNWALQRGVERSVCAKCKGIASGTRVRGGFLCEECIRVFMIRKQLWIYPVEFRDRIIVDEALKKR